MERYLCLDLGDKRIGVAVSDPFNSYSLPIETYARKNLKTDLDRVLRYVSERGATAVVCGLPVNFDGTPSVQTKKAEFFIEKLRERGIKVITVDERCTSVAAEETLYSQGKSRAEVKRFVDSLAAAEILQGYLNDLKKENANKGALIMKEERKHHCGCGCEEHEEHEHVHSHDDCDCCSDECDCCDCEDEIVELTTDDGKKLKFYVVGTIEYKGKNYSAFEPAEKIDGIEEDDLVIFELAGDDEENADLLPIEDEQLLDEVFEEFCRVLEEDELAEEAESLEPKN